LMPDVPVELIGDPLRLRQVIINLLGNAIKFTERGEIVLRVEQDPAGPMGALQCSVSDSGIGISADKLDTIFNSFAQAEASHTRKYGGSGLGWSICRQLVELMGGRIWVESRFGQGSIFYFTARMTLQEPASTYGDP